MRLLHISFSLAVLGSLLLGVVQPGTGRPIAPATASASQAANPSVYVPAVPNGSAAPSTIYDLIDADVAGGKLTAEQGLVYKVFAQFSDARLPSQYVSATNGREGDLIMEEVANQAATLSPSAKQTLTPFFVPPNDPRSWYYLSHLAASGSAQGAEADPGAWVFKSAAGGKIKVYYYSDNASDEAKATAIAAQFDATIWDKLTTLMNKTPLPNAAGSTDIYLWTSYIKNNGTIVAFNANTLGITVGSRCDQTAVTIYLPDGLPIGSANSPGLIQYATHEFMHAIQFAGTIQSCSNYGWLKEATATWAEDYVYPAANSEQETASGYLNNPTARLDNRSHLHDYGAYMLFYFLTHKVDTTAAVIRDVWQNAATTANSYKALDDAVSQAAPCQGSLCWHDLYWPLYLGSLWNQAPFDAYYSKFDGLTTTVAQAGGSATNVEATSGEQITPLYSEIPTGGALYFRLNFPDTSVRSLTILNGLGHKLSTGDASSRATYVTDGDETYLTEDSAPADLQGVNVDLLLKASGQAAYPVVMPLTSNLSSISDYNNCLDMQGPMEEVVVILSNSDWANPDRKMKPQGLPVTVFANNVPCWKVTGTAKAMDYSDSAMVQEAEGTVTYGWPSAITNAHTPQAYENLGGAFPETDLRLLSANATWKVSAGASSDCTYTGSGSYTSSEASNDSLTLLYGLTAGSPTYRGYVGQGDADPGATGSYKVKCPNQDEYTENWSDGPPSFLDIPLGMVEDCGHIKVDADGNMSGSCKVPNYPGRYQYYEWNLHGEKK